MFSLLYSREHSKAYKHHSWETKQKTLDFKKNSLENTKLLVTMRQRLEASNSD